MPKRGLALEGGGARGAYHMGVCKAYIERGYEFDGFVGTSIGAINAVMLASGEFDKALELWESIELDHLFDQELLDAFKLDKNAPTTFATAIKKILTDRGVDHSKIKKFLASYIVEEKVRATGLDFGLVTFSLNERKPYEIFLKDIPEGKLVDYILASAKLPFLTAHTIDDSRFIDGGVYNNCPINMLIDQGYDEIIAVRTKGFGLFRRYDRKANVTLIETNENLGNFLSFGPNNSKLNIQRGYCDALKVIDNLSGEKYYLKDANLTPLIHKLLTLDKSSLIRLMHFHETSIDPRRILLEDTLPEIADFLDLGKSFTYEALMLSMLEFVATKKEIDHLDVYLFDDFLKLIEKKPTITSESLLSKVGIDFIEKKTNLIVDLVDLLL